MKRLLVRGGVFLAALVLLLAVISQPFRLDDVRLADTYEELYSAKRNSCDAVLIGASNCYAYFQSPFAWRDSGITVCNMGTPAISVNCLKYSMEEARKTQPDALYVITANSLKWGYNDMMLPHLVNYMHFGWNKLAAINDLSNKHGIGLERVKYFFPVLQFHGNWSTLSPLSYVPQYKNVKGGSYYQTFACDCVDVSDQYVETDRRLELSHKFSNALDDFFDYVETSGVKVLFVRLPQALIMEDSYARLNTVCDMIQERGFDFVDMQDSALENDIDYTADFYDIKHANIHGSVKFTHYLSEYLQKTYGFADKRGVEGYEDWVAAESRYTDFAKTMLFDFELDHEKLDLTLPRVQPEVISSSDGTVSLSWDDVPEADTIYVYRRQKSGYVTRDLIMRDDLPTYQWQRIAELPAGSTGFVDNAQLEDGKTYSYAVIPATRDAGMTRYGSGSTTGVPVYVGGAS